MYSCTVVLRLILLLSLPALSLRKTPQHVQADVFTIIAGGGGAFLDEDAYEIGQDIAIKAPSKNRVVQVVITDFLF